MSDRGVGAAVVISSALAATTSSIFPLLRSPVSFQATIVTVGTGTSTYTGATVINVSNDNIGFFPVGTLTVTGTLAAAGSSSSTAAAGVALGANWPYKYARLDITTLTTGVGSALSGMIVQ